MADQHAEEHYHDHHGQSVASWTLVGFLLLAAVFICLSFPLAGARTVLLSIGIALGVIGLIAGKVLAANGYGIASGEVTHIADAPDIADKDEAGIS